MRSATKYSAEQLCVARTPEVGQHWKGRLFPPSTGLHSQLPPRASLPPSSLRGPLPQCPAHKPLGTKNVPVGCTWLWLIWIISKGLLQPERAQGTSGAASELGSSRLAVGGMETSFKYQELCNTAFKTIFKSSEGKFKFTEVMENSVTSTDVCLADSKNYVMSRPAQSHVTGVLITTTSYISVHLRKHQFNFGIFLGIWSSELQLYSYTFLHYILGYKDLLCRSAADETRLVKYVYVCVCRAGAEKEGSCSFLHTIIYPKKAINMFS